MAQVVPDGQMCRETLLVMIQERREGADALLCDHECCVNFGPFLCWLEKFRIAWDETIVIEYLIPIITVMATRLYTQEWKAFYPTRISFLKLGHILQ